MYAITLKVTLHQEVLDPAGRAVQKQLNSIGFPVQDVRIGKLITLKVDTKNVEEAEEKAKLMAEKLLANTVMESYSIKVKKV